MRKYRDSLDCRNVSTSGAKMYGYSNSPSLSGKKDFSPISKFLVFLWKFFFFEFHYLM